MKILIVEDKPTDLKLLRAQLEAEGYMVAQAQDGVEALELLDRQRVDVVISDILMPRMDGYRLCHEIRKRDRLCNLPTIIYSATYTSPSDVKLAFDLGANKFLNKPSSVQIIIAALNEVLAKPNAAPCTEALPEVEALKEYSERLVDKLEEKSLEREQAKAELSATRDQLEHLLKHSPAVIYSLKLDGERVIPQLISDNMTHLLGFTVEETSNVDWWVTQLHPEDRERAMAGVPETIKCGIWNTEYRIRHKGGHYLWVEDHRRLVRNAEDKPTDIVVVWTNITERKQTQNQVLRAQRLESIGTLACGVAHDVNNALVPIMISTELLRLEFPNLASKHLKVIETSAKRGANMVKQLLTFVKGAEGERLHVQPQHLLKEVEKLIKATFPSNIELHTIRAKDLRAILGDTTQLQQVLVNLCVNARDAMPDGGTLTLKVESIEIDAAVASAIAEAKPGRYVAWSVTDTGAGIPLEILDRIFEPFFSTKGPDKGTGLGLSTVIGIVKSHGGFLQVSSTLGLGTTFIMYLPTARLDRADVSLPSKIDMNFRGNGETVLVVEDKTALRNALRTMLTKLNFKVLTASDGAAALIQVAENQAKLRVVITDLHMPNMDGLALMRVLKAKLPQAAIIVASGKTNALATGEFKKLGINAQLEKPFTLEKLVATLKKVFRQ
jgi:PAS domain S-box-containing protein